MKSYLNFTLLFWLLSISLLVNACQEPDENLKSTYISDEVEFSEGTAELWVEIGSDDTPFGMGVIISEEFLTDPPEEELNVVLPWPDEVDPISPYQHLRLYFDPDGHDPAGFDNSQVKFRTYLIDETEYEELKEADLEERTVEPDSTYQAPNLKLLERDEENLPPVGSQWVNTGHMPDQDEVFTYAFAWGFNNGELVYLETKVNEAALRQLPEPENILSIPQPEAYQREGHYPNTNRITFNENSGNTFIGKEELEFEISE